MFAALYAHARRNMDALGLNEHERRMTRFSFWQQIIHAFVAVLVAIGASLPFWWAPMSGFGFFFVGPLIFLAGAINMPKGKAKAEAASS
jgi:protein-S-isoprenylcysteine O-methyltransferase Ste14